MPKPTFIHDDFLLQNDFAQQLYHDYAKDQPIIDYHCHLSPADIAQDRVFNNITEAWIHGDHYKWRAMRTAGIKETYITGEASDKDKFLAWAKTVPQTLRNPLYHWAHLELARYFGIYELLNEKNASEIYEEVSRQLQQPKMGCRGLLTSMQVEVVCTTEDPTDTLEHHKAMAQSGSALKMSTSFRPDKAIFIANADYNRYIDALGATENTVINSYTDLCEVLEKRLDFFHQNGCRVSDHGLERISYAEYTDAEINAIFERKRQGSEPTMEEVEKFHTAIQVFLSEGYHKRGWVQQFHLGALRNNNQRMLSQLGPDTGWDSIGDFPQAQTLSKFLDRLDTNDTLCKTILYNLNPGDNEVLATMVGNFNDGSVRGKVQFGSGWWFLDQKDGMTKQMNTLSNMGLISCFVGMLTDSRSFLSFPRHEYFRRLLCNLLGTEIQNGELPQDLELIGNMVKDISYGNAKDYFGF
jgi:glucuronate isomerase